MERLTFVDEDGQVLFDNPAGFPEDVGFTIRELAENEEWKTLDNIAQRLANCEQRLKYYEDLEEQGKLLKLPCVVGDTVYRICPKCNDAHNGSCKNCAWENSCSNRGCTVYGGWKDGQYPMGKCTIVPYKASWNYIPNLLENIGKRVFLTKEEAEAALKEL